MLAKLKTALVLVIIGAISGGLIYGTNLLTKDQIAENERQKEFVYYAEIFNLDYTLTESNVVKTQLDGTIQEEVQILDQEGNLLGYVYKGYDNNTYGYVTALVAINLDGTIRQVVISSTNNTPKYVGLTDPDHLDPFIGQDSGNVTFDERTGATFTYGSITKIVEAASTYFQMNRGGE